MTVIFQFSQGEDKEPEDLDLDIHHHIWSGKW